MVKLLLLAHNEGRALPVRRKRKPHQRSDRQTDRQTDRQAVRGSLHHIVAVSETQSYVIPQLLLCYMTRSFTS